MNSSIFKFFVLLLTQILWLGESVAQSGRPTEREINTQKVFIEANREKLLGKYENAAVLYKEVLKRDRNNDAAAYELARLYDVLEKNEKALQTIQMAVALDEKNQWYQMFLADIYGKMNKHEKAAGIYGELVSKYPTNDYFYVKQAYSLVKGKEASKAIKVYDNMEKKFGIAEDIVGKKYRLYMGMGNKKKAEAELVKLVNAYPYSTSVRHQLADFYLTEGKDAEALKVYKEILEINPDDADANIVVAGNNKGNSSDLVYLNSLKKIFANPELNIDAKVKELFPFIQKMENSKDEQMKAQALVLAESLTNAHPEDAKSYAVYGDMLYHSGKTAEARKVYEKTLALPNNVFSVHEQLMYLYAEQNDMDQLLDFSENAMDLYPNKAKVYYFHGVANSQKRNYKDALGSFEQALMMCGKDQVLKYDVMSRLGVVYSELGKMEKAGKTLKDASALNPDHPTYYFQYANAWLSYKSEDYDEAKTWLDKALKNGGDDDADVLEAYGDLLFQTNKVEEAITYWTKAKHNGSNSALLDKKIANRRL